MAFLPTTRRHGAAAASTKRVAVGSWQNVLHCGRCVFLLRALRVGRVGRLRGASLTLQAVSRRTGAGGRTRRSRPTSSTARARSSGHLGPSRVISTPSRAVGSRPRERRRRGRRRDAAARRARAAAVSSTGRRHVRPAGQQAAHQRRAGALCGQRRRRALPLPQRARRAQLIN